MSIIKKILLLIHEQLIYLNQQLLENIKLKKIIVGRIVIN